MRNPFRYLSKIPLRLRRWARRTKRAAISWLARVAWWSVGHLSLDQALHLGEVAGAVHYRVLRKRRRLALDHLGVAFGDELTPNARDHLARASFVNSARCFCELAKIDEIRARRGDYFELEGWEHVRGMLAEGKGLIAITGHIGNSELLGAYFAWQGLPVAAITRRVHAARLNQSLVDFRRRQGVETILRESPNSTLQILRALQNNAMLAMVIDQDTHAPSGSVPFFGRLARTPAAAASLAIRCDLPVVAVFIQRRGNSGHRITICPPFAIERSGDTRADISVLTRQFSVALDTQIRKNPAEWVWWQRRWRRQPLPHLDLDRDFQYTLPDVSLHNRG